jgi:hypothetical protein
LKFVRPVIAASEFFLAKTQSISSCVWWWQKRWDDLDLKVHGRANDDVEAASGPVQSPAQEIITNGVYAANSNDVSCPMYQLDVDT